MNQADSTRRIANTACASTTIRPLRAVDIAPLVALMRRNRRHLNAHSSWDEVIDGAQADLQGRVEGDGPPLAFAIWCGDHLAGGLTLLPVNPPRFGLSYWVDAGHTRRGAGTAAVAEAVEHARPMATDLYAGVTHGNTASVRVLRRAGFAAIEEFEEYTRYHLRLADTATIT